MKLKALNKGYPKLDFPSNVEFVDFKEFARKESDRIPLFVGTQFGIFPREFSDFSNFLGSDIAIISKSLLSGVQLDMKILRIDDASLKSLQENHRMEL